METKAALLGDVSHRTACMTLSPFEAGGDGNESLLHPYTGMFRMFWKGFFAYSMNFERK